MRLVCPRCKAEYEVGDSAIPPTGRDVQCSACGHIWLQAPVGGWPEETGPDQGEPEAAEDAGEEAGEADDSPLPQAEPETSADEPPPEASLDVTTEPAPPGQDVAVEPTDSAEDAEAQQDREQPPRRNPAASPEVIAILREEAEREARARRRGNMAGLEVQSDLGLADAPPPLRPAPPGEDASTPPPRGLDRLPAIDEIDTASLRPAPRRSLSGATGPSKAAVSAAAMPGGGARRRGRYRAGFLLSVAIATVAALVYARSGDIAAALPEAGPAIQAYAAGIDDLRLRLDDIMRAAAAALSALADRAGA